MSRLRLAAKSMVSNMRQLLPGGGGSSTHEEGATAAGRAAAGKADAGTELAAVR